MVTERRQNVKKLLERLINFNEAKRNEYYGLSLDVQKNYGINDYFDLHANLVNYCISLNEQKGDIISLPDSQLVIIEQVLLKTAKVVGVKTSDIQGEAGSTVEKNVFPEFDSRNPPNPFELMAAFGLHENLSTDFQMIQVRGENTRANPDMIWQFLAGLTQITVGVLGLIVFSKSLGIATAIGIAATKNILDGIGKCMMAVFGFEYGGTLVEIVRIVGQQFRLGDNNMAILLNFASIVDTILSAGLNRIISPNSIYKIMKKIGHAPRYCKYYQICNCYRA